MRWIALIGILLFVIVFLQLSDTTHQSELPEIISIEENGRTTPEVPSAGLSGDVIEENDVTTPEALSVGVSEHAIRVGDTTRYYKIYAPQKNMSGRPLLVYLHGGGQDMRIIENNAVGAGLRRLADRERVLVLVPNGSHRDTGDAYGTQQRWNDDLLVDLPAVQQVDDVQFLTVLVRDVQERYETSKESTYITGVSNGAFMIQRLLREAPEPYAAAATMLATMANNPLTLNTDSVRPTPIMLWANTEDPNFAGGDGGLGGPLISAEEAYEWWQLRNRASETVPAQSISEPDENGCYTSQRRSYGDAPTYFTVTHGGGHIISSIDFHLGNPRFLQRNLGYQCKDIEAIDVVWEFLKRF